MPYLWLRADSHLAEVDGEDGMRAGALGVHLRAGGGAGKSAQLQTLQQLRSKHIVLSFYSLKLSVVLKSSRNKCNRLLKLISVKSTIALHSQSISSSSVKLSESK